MVDFENYHGGCCIFQSELLETHPKQKVIFGFGEEFLVSSHHHPLPFLIPSSPSSLPDPFIPHPFKLPSHHLIPLSFISQILHPLIHSSLLRTTVIPLPDLIPSSRVGFFGASSSGGDPPMAEATPSPGLTLPSPFLQLHTSPTNNGGCAAGSHR